jgi:hypothetical protein
MVLSQFTAPSQQFFGVLAAAKWDLWFLTDTALLRGCLKAGNKHFVKI